MTTLNDYKKKCLDIFYASDVVNKELTFGCEVQHEDEDAEPDIIAFVTPATDGVQQLLHFVGDSPDEGIPMSWIGRHAEILGHPPQLQDWLALLETKYQVTLQTLFKKTSIFVGQDHANRIYFNLTTGQPATEDDWKALYELIK